MDPYQPTTYQLEDGTLIQVRPVREEDAPRIQALVGRLSPESSYLRFHEPLRQLPQQTLYEFTHLDYHQRMALAAVLPEGSDERLVAVARYSTGQPVETGRAEVGVVVEDGYQGQGLGFYLLRELTIYARRHGIHTFTGTISPSNNRILEIIAETGLQFKRTFVEGVWEVEINLRRQRGRRSDRKTGSKGPPDSG